MALLRLAPDHQGEALAAARPCATNRRSHPLCPGLEKRADRRLGAILGGRCPVAIALERRPSRSVRHPGLGPDAGQAAIYDLDAIRVERPNDDPLVKISLVPSCRRERRKGPTCQQSRFMLARSIPPTAIDWPSPATIWPSALESSSDGLKRLVRSSENVTDEPKC